MTQFWKDLETDAGEWFGLALQCRADGGSHKPALHLESGNNGRIRLVQHESTGPVTRFWATPGRDHSCVHWLRNDAPVASPIPATALDAAVVERYAALPPAQRLAAWSRFFAAAIAQGPASFLHPGLWIFMGARPAKAPWQFESAKLPRSHWQWRVENARDALRDDPVAEIDWWWGSTNEVLALRAPPHPDDGRVKWWRKKVRENALPPILLWHLGCLQSHVIVDGHCRLQAAILENHTPELLVAYSAYEEPVQQPPERQQQILDSLQAQISNERPRPPQRKPLDTQTLNAVLIAAFDDRPVLNAQTQAWATRQTESQWLQEVQSRLAALGRNEMMAAFASR